MSRLTSVGRYIITSVIPRVKVQLPVGINKDIGDSNEQNMLQL